MPNWSGEIFIIRKINNTAKILMVKKLLVLFMKMNCKRLIKKKFRIEKVVKKKGDKLYVKWKGYDNYFNSWIDKKDIV